MSTATPPASPPSRRSILAAMRAAWRALRAASGALDEGDRRAAANRLSKAGRALLRLSR